MKGKRAAPVKLIKRKLQQLQTETVEICIINEYPTNPIYSVCKHRSLKNVTTAAPKRRVRAALQCKNCNTVGIATSMLPKKL
ncbi:hypothetical protein BDF20DRAFT_847620 [Mycotypha africana]|uniref:uncharacterized protein n=1 Tax=Mycotypha africana TaxID=64632 RepID=UPI0023003A5A|nr:uncharacterized protein BDF20DRAFT_847620 [Mycotypha africana]KAI8991985.1 hypothetical protein BDF20DRAFT_847620 [Mycotypha africana]